MRVLGELEYLEGLVKWARIKKDEKASRNQITSVNNTLVVKRMNKTYEQNLLKENHALAHRDQQWGD